MTKFSYIVLASRLLFATEFLKTYNFSVDSMHLQGIVYALAALILFTEANVFTVQDRVPATLGEKLQLR